MKDYNDKLDEIFEGFGNFFNKVKDKFTQKSSDKRKSDKEREERYGEEGSEAFDKKYKDHIKRRSTFNNITDYINQSEEEWSRIKDEKTGLTNDINKIKEDIKKLRNGLGGDDDENIKDQIEKLKNEINELQNNKRSLSKKGAINKKYSAKYNNDVIKK
jgi:chromosome segregation ATPase